MMKKVTECAEFKLGEWYEFATLPKEYRVGTGYGKTFRARQGKWAPYDAMFVYGEFRPIPYGGSYHPTHWSPIAT